MLWFLLIILIAVPAVLMFITIKLWRSKRSVVHWLAIVPVAIFGYLALQIYWGLYPREEFYREEWMRSVGTQLPMSAIFEAKDATFPDIHGDYSAIAVVRCQNGDMEAILDQLKNMNFNADTTGLTIVGMVDGFDRAVKGVDFRHPSVVLVSSAVPWFRVSILKDGNTLVFERHSS